MMQKSPLATMNYNSLLDEHLAEFFSSPRRRRHLRRMGLITREGRLVDERTFERRAMQKECRMMHRDERETTAAAIVNEKQWKKKAELKKKLEALAKYETVQKMKKEKLHPLGIPTYRPEKRRIGLGQTSASPGQAPLKTSPSVNSSPHLSRAIERHKERVTFTQEELQDLKHLVETIEGAKGVIPSVLHSTVVPTTPKPRSSKNGSRKVIHKRPNTAPTKSRKQKAKENVSQELDCEKPVRVTLCYLGVTTVKRRSLGPVVDIEVKQQARGYTPVPVYTGSIRAGESFSFDSIRYPGMPFALAIYTSGMIDCRVSVCCEYRHRAGTLLGGRSAHFKVVSIERGSPCHLCEKAREKKKSKLTRALRSSSYAHSTPQLSSTLESTQLNSLLRQHIAVRGEREGESASPASSLYSVSFHSEPSGDEGNGEVSHQRSESSCSLSESEHSTFSKVVNKNDPDGGQTSGANTDQVTTSNVLTEVGEDLEATTEGHPETVTRGGVRIVYQLGPVPTSESGTQTDGQYTPDQQTGDAPQSGSEATIAVSCPAPVTDGNTAVEEQKPKVRETSEGVIPDPLQLAESDTATTKGHGELTDSKVLVDEPAPYTTDNNTHSSTNPTPQDNNPEPTDTRDNAAEPLVKESLLSKIETAALGDLDSISTSTLTHVSERDMSGSISSGSRATLQTDVKSEQKNAEKADSQTDDGDHAATQEFEVNESQEHNTGGQDVCEEEFTKAWT